MLRLDRKTPSFPSFSVPATQEYPLFSIVDCQNIVQIIKYGIDNRYIFDTYATRLIDKIETFTKIASELPSSESRTMDITVYDLRDAYYYVEEVFNRFNPPDSVADDQYQRYVLGYVLEDDYSSKGPYGVLKKMKDTLYAFIKYYDFTLFEE